MAIDYLLQEEGGRIELEQSSHGFLILETSPDRGSEGGGGGKKATQKGVSIYDIGERPHYRDWRHVKGKLLFKDVFVSRAKIAFHNENVSNGVLVSKFINETFGKIKVSQKLFSESKLLFKLRSVVLGGTQRFYLNEQFKRLNESMARRIKIKKMETLFKMFRAVEGLDRVKPLLPVFNVSSRITELNRGDLYPVSATIDQEVREVWMRILDKPTSTIVQKAGLMGKDRTAIQAFISTKDLPEGDYIIQFSSNNKFTPLGTQEFKVKETLLIPAAALAGTGTGLVVAGTIFKRAKRPEDPGGITFGRLVYHTMMDAKVDSACRKFQNKVFDVDDPKIPQIPIHFNCRCWYEPFLPEN